ncbi:MAG: sugar transferase [Terriglobales bacterium]
MSGPRLRWMLLALDWLALLASFVLAYLLRFHNLPHAWERHLPIYLWPLAVAAVAWALLYPLLGLDGFRDGWHVAAAVSRLSTAVPIAIGLAAATLYFERIYISRLWLSLFALQFGLGVLLVRVVVVTWLRSRHRSGTIESVLLVGEPALLTALERKLEQHPEMLMRVAGKLLPAFETEPGDGDVSSLDVLDWIRTQRIRHLIVALSQSPGREFQELLDRCRALGVRVFMLPQPYELYTRRLRLVDLGGVPLLSTEDMSAPAWQRRWKRVLDFVVLALISPLVIPLLLGCVVALLLAGVRKPLRRESRCGRHGVIFGMWLLALVPSHSRLEAWMHRYSLRDLPQLWNVLRGSMTLVGPRPEGPEQVRGYTEWQRRRLELSPGVTGLAQVHHLRDETSVEAKTHFDLQYLIHWTPLLDISLLLQTVTTLAGRYRRRAAAVAARDAIIPEPLSVNRP